MSAHTANCLPAQAVSGLAGSLVALATPFAGGEVDLDGVTQLSERQVRGGTSGIVVCGSTGEGASLADHEHAAVVAAAALAAANKVAVIASCGAGSTAKAVALAAAAARAGATALLSAPPPYVKPTQEGIIAHIQAIARAVDLPVILYDVPSRASVGVADATVARLFEAGLICGIKDAASDAARPIRLRALCGPGLLQFSGDDATAGAHRAMGGHGCISVTANLVPALCAQFHAAWTDGDLQAATRLGALLAPLHDALFVESNPMPLKSALLMLRLCGGDVRLPLTRASRPTRDRLASLLTSVMIAEDEAFIRPQLALVR